MASPARLVIVCLLPLASLAAQAPATPCFENSIEALRAAVAADPESLGLKLRLSQALLRRDKETAHPDVAKARLEEVHGIYEAVLAKNPRLTAPLRVLAADAYHRDDFEKAIALGRRVLEIEPADTEIARTVLKAYVRLGRFEESADFLVRWVERGTIPSFGSMHGLLSTLVAHPSVRTSLGEKLETACSTGAKDPELILFHSVYLAEAGRPEAAWKELQRAEAIGLCDLRTGARHTFTQSLKARASEQDQTMANYDGLDLEEIARRTQTHPEHVGLLMRHARLLDLAGRLDEALAAYARVAELKPDYWPAFLRQGEILIQRKQPAEAVPVLERARELFPANLAITVLLARALIGTGDLEGGCRLLATLAATEPPTSHTREIYADLAGREEGKGLGVLQQALLAALKERAVNPYLHAHLAVLHLAAGRSPQAQQEALAAERCGLFGQDGHPAALLFEAFGKPDPLARPTGKE